MIFFSHFIYPINVLEDRFSKLELRGCPIQVLPYTTNAACGIIIYELKYFGYDYDDEICSKSRLLIRVRHHD